MSMAIVPIDRQNRVYEYNYYMDGRRTRTLFKRSRTFRRAWYAKCGSSRRLVVETFEEDEEEEQQQKEKRKNETKEEINDFYEDNR